MSKKGDVHWTKSQIEILQKLYPTTNINELSRMLNKTVDAIRTKAIRMKISKKVENLADGLKRCPHCRRVLLLSGFYKGQSWCKECMAQRRKKWGEENKKYLANYRFIRVKRNPDRMKELSIIGSHKSRALVKEGHSLTQQEWKEILNNYQNICPMCHKPFTAKDPAVRDCIIPLCKGGLLNKSNVQPLHNKCNLKKGRKIILFSLPGYYRGKYV